MITAVVPDLGQPLLRRAELGDLALPNRVVMAPVTRPAQRTTGWSRPRCMPLTTPSGPGPG